jgi:tetratricopeptide (TPR) repeat protein
LTDTPERRQVWGQQYEAGGNELLTLHQLVARQIVCRLVTNIEDSVLARAAVATTERPSAFEDFVRGRALLRRYGPGVNEQAQAHLQRAVDTDPDFGLAHAYLALAEAVLAGFGTGPRPVLEAARARALHAVELAPQEARCHWIAGFIRSLLDEHAAAEHALRRAVELNPCDADSLFMLGDMLTVRGRAAEGLALMDRAIVLNPLHPDWYHADRSFALYLLGRYEESAAVLGCLPQLTARQETRMAAGLALAGRPEAAADHLDRAEAKVPGCEPEELARTYHLERAEDLEHPLRGVEMALGAREALHRG